MRPVIDFASVTYHSMLTDEQSEKLEQLQQRALKIIYGTNIGSSERLERSGLQELRIRRENMFVKFAIKCSKNPKIKDSWFPLAEENNYNLREVTKYREEIARTDRLKNSPIYRMRKRLNEL